MPHLDAPVSWKSLIVLLLAAILSIGCTGEYSNGPGETSAVGDAASDESLPDEAALAAMIDEVLAENASRYLDPSTQNAWQIVHGVLAYGSDLQITVEGELRPALPWILEGGNLDGWKLVPGEKGLDTILEAGSKSGQGHDDQWLGYLAQCGLPPDTTILVHRADGQGDATYRLIDLVTEAQWDVHEGMEATWTLMGLSEYLPPDATWVAEDGSQWSLERIVDMEAAEELAASACGGSHRLYGLTTALERHRQAGLPPTGPWQAAEEKIHAAIQKAREFQEPNGAFSIHYFQRPGTSPDIALRINTTGHTLELISAVLSPEELASPWVTRSAVCLCDMLKKTKDLPLECGGLYHAIHALKVYRERRFADTPHSGSSASADTSAASSPANGVAGQARSGGM